MDTSDYDTIVEKARNADRALFELRNMIGCGVLDLGRLQCILEGKQ